MYQGTCDNSSAAGKTVLLDLSPQFFEQNRFVRVIAKDKSLCPGGIVGTNANDDLEARVGTIGFKSEDFAAVSQEPNSKYA